MSHHIFHPDQHELFVAGLARAKLIAEKHGNELRAAIKHDQETCSEQIIDVRDEAEKIVEKFEESIAKGDAAYALKIIVDCASFKSDVLQMDIGLSRFEKCLNEFVEQGGFANIGLTGRISTIPEFLTEEEKQRANHYLKGDKFLLQVCKVFEPQYQAAAGNPECVEELDMMLAHFMVGNRSIGGGWKHILEPEKGFSIEMSDSTTGGINLSHTTTESFGRHNEINGDANFTGCRKLSEIGEGNKFNGDLILTGCVNLRKLPDDITIKGRTVLPDGSVAADITAARRWFARTFSPEKPGAGYPGQ